MGNTACIYSLQKDNGFSIKAFFQNFLFLLVIRERILGTFFLAHPVLVKIKIRKLQTMYKFLF